MLSMLRVAIISGPQYDGVGELLSSFTAASGIDVDVAFRGDHGKLNRHLAEALRSGPHYDLVSTHSKYAPSQAEHLLDLTGRVDLAGMADHAVELCRFAGRQLCVPRNIDARLLWGRRHLLKGMPLPDSWESVRATARKALAPFALPGTGSGLFGTFFELVVSHGGELFGTELDPHFDGDAAIDALEWLRGMKGELPPDVERWGYDEVAAGLREGSASFAGDWPAYFAELRAAVPDEDLVVGPYPRGPARRAVYSGCHAYAIPSDAPHAPEAAALLAHLVGPASARHEAERGMLPARADVPLPASDELSVRRTDLLARSVAEDMITFPPLRHYPEIEDAAWPAVQAAMVGRVPVQQAAAEMQRIAMAAVAAEREASRA